MSASSLTGTLTGSSFIGSGKIEIETKNYNTGGINFGMIGGFVGPELRWSGWDHVVITGKAPHPVYIYIHDDQVDWYAAQVERLKEEAGRTVPSLIFFHIPLQQYRTAYELYMAGSPEVKYFFGENGEQMIDKVCCSDYPSRLFDRMLELGSTTGVFCGHDHYNNMSLEYKGIRLTYGMSIDYLAMPGIENDTAQRGAELITIHPDATWDLVQIPLTSIT